MKSLVLALLFVTTAVTASAQTPTMKILRNGTVFRCDPEEHVPPSEEWSCKTEETSRDGHLLEYGCKGQTPWACTVTVKESCEERVSGRHRNRSNNEFRGCADSLGDCW